jgi:hypothetical protein
MHDTPRVYVEIDTALTEILHDPTTTETERTEALRESELLRTIRKLESLRATLEASRTKHPEIDRERERQGLFRDMAHTINILGRKARIRDLNNGEESAPLFPRAYTRMIEHGRQPQPTEGAILTYQDVISQPLRALDLLFSDIVPYSREAQPIGTGEAWDGVLDRMAETHGYLLLSLIEWSRVLETPQGREWIKGVLSEESEYIEDRINELSEEWDEMERRGETEGIRRPDFNTDPEGRGMFGLRGVRIG